MVFANNSKHNLLVYLETLDEEQNKALRLREVPYYWLFTAGKTGLDRR